MSDQATANGIQGVATAGSTPNLVGEVTQFCSSKRVAIVGLINGGRVGNGYELQFGTRERPCTRRRPVISVNVTSIQLNGTTVLEAVGPGSFGIKTGNRGMGIGTPVYVVKAVAPVEG
ncbi:MAG: hypothetical protein WC734_02485 [Patescibacteria group bacterium]